MANDNMPPRYLLMMEDFSEHRPAPFPLKEVADRHVRLDRAEQQAKEIARAGQPVYVYKLVGTAVKPEVPAQFHRTEPIPEIDE